MNWFGRPLCLYKKLPLRAPPLLSRSHSPHLQAETSGMTTTIDPVTPQLKAARKWIDAYITLDINEIDGLFPKDYKHLTLPKSMGLPEETKEEYLQRYGGFLPAFTKFEVRTKHPAAALQLMHPFQMTYHDVIEVPGKVVIHVRPST